MRRDRAMSRVAAVPAVPAVAAATGVAVVGKLMERARALRGRRSTRNPLGYAAFCMHERNPDLLRRTRPRLKKDLPPRDQQKKTEAMKAEEKEEEDEKHG